MKIGFCLGAANQMIARIKEADPPPIRYLRRRVSHPVADVNRPAECVRRQGSRHAYQTRTARSGCSCLILSVRLSSLKV